jgi:hypothetical protein
MFSSKTFVITIGNNGTIVALHNKKNIISKIFIEELSDDGKIEIEKIFKQNKQATIYILLDTVDQSYKKKIYPSIRKTDIHRIAKRDLFSDGDSQSIKNFLILSNRKIHDKSQLHSVKWNSETGAKLECLFISASNADFINKWIDYLLDLPNRVAGIYMLPAEAFSFFKIIKNAIDNRSKIKNKKNDLYLIIIQNKVCGTRQIVFNEQGVIFTRVVNYDFSNANFLEKYEQDIYSTFEYLKRLYRDVALNELDIINILPDNIIDFLKTSANPELNYINLNPHSIAKEVGNQKIIPTNSSNCDLLISNVFANSKKFLKFTNEKIKKLEDFFVISISIFYANTVVLFLIILSIIGNIYFYNSGEKIIEKFDGERLGASNELSRIKKSFLMETQENIDNIVDSPERIDDLGKMQEIFGNIFDKNIDFYSQLKFIKNYSVKLNKFMIVGGSINNKIPSQIPSYQISFAGDLINESGDIDDLFASFDDLNSAVRKEYEGNEVKTQEMARDMDFTKKYPTYPVTFNVNRNMP